MKSSSLVSRWRWAAHARRCAACAEVRAAERFVAAFAARAGRWPAAGTVTRGVPRRWQWAAAAAVIAVLLPLLLSGLWPRRDRISAASAREIRTVHWVGEQTIDGWTTPQEETIQYPDRRRLTTEGGVIVTDLDEDRELTVLNDYTTLPWHPKPYRYLLERPLSHNITARESFTLEGRLNGSGKDGRTLLQHEVSRLPDGRELHTLQYEDPKLPWLGPVTKLWVDPKTDLILAWDITDGWDTADGRHVKSRYVANAVEYNVDLPEGYFSTEPPKGEAVVDRFTPEGIKRDYLGALAELEGLPADKQAVLAKEWRDNGCFNKLDYLSPADQAEIREKLRAFGLDRSVTAAARPREQSGSMAAKEQRDRAELEQALAQMKRDRAEVEKALREAQPKPDEATMRAEVALARARLLEAQARVKSELRARRKALPEMEAARQRTQAQLRQSLADLEQARAAARKGDERAQEARKQLEAAEAALRAQLKDLAAKRAEMEKQLQHAEQQRTEAEKALAAAQARIEEAQRALVAAREADKGDRARIEEARRALEAAREAGKRK